MRIASAKSELSRYRLNAIASTNISCFTYIYKNKTCNGSYTALTMKKCCAWRPVSFVLIVVDTNASPADANL